jgi:soluble lytic murein transglycosylase
MAKKPKVKKFILQFILVCLVIIVLFYNPVSIRLMTLSVAVYYSLDPVKFYRLVSTESSFRSLAVSSKQAIGLGQIKEGTAGYVNERHKRGLLFLPTYNLKISALYLKYLLSRYKDNWSLALAAYNWGETNVDRRIKGISIQTDKNYIDLFSDIPETRLFISKIMKNK